MRFTAVLIGLFALFIFLIPLSTLRRNTPVASLPTTVPPTQSQPVSIPSSSSDPHSQEDETASTEPLDVENVDLAAVEYFNILNRSTGKVEKVPVRDYVRGAVASEMPATFHLEALKAQAVSAHTYALYQHLFQERSPDPSLKGADFSADPQNMLGYTTEKVLKARLGDLGDEHWNKICQAADSVLGYILVYEGEPIVAAYHSISGGITEDAQNVWQGNAPYLAAVDSPGDLLSPALESKVSFTAAELQSLLNKHFSGLKLSSDPSTWLTILERSDSGYITQMQVGNLTVHGKEVRTALDLKSTDLTFDFKNGTFTFHVLGYGHGVGLSQYGADYMARQGSSFDEILTHYYTGVSLALVE